MIILKVEKRGEVSWKICKRIIKNNKESKCKSGRKSRAYPDRVCTSCVGQGRGKPQGETLARPKHLAEWSWRNVVCDHEWRLVLAALSFRDKGNNKTLLCLFLCALSGRKKLVTSQGWLAAYSVFVLNICVNYP